MDQLDPEDLQILDKWSIERQLFGRTPNPPESSASTEELADAVIHVGPRVESGALFVQLGILSMLSCFNARLRSQDSAASV